MQTKQLPFSAIGDHKLCYVTSITDSEVWQWIDVLSYAMETLNSYSSVADHDHEHDTKEMKNQSKLL